MAIPIIRLDHYPPMDTPAFIHCPVCGESLFESGDDRPCSHVAFQLTGELGVMHVAESIPEPVRSSIEACVDGEELEAVLGAADIDDVYCFFQQTSVVGDWGYLGLCFDFDGVE